jgi:hypothetical protein
MRKRAIAYINEIDLSCQDEVITREYQQKEIEKHAAAKDIEIVAWFEDTVEIKEVLDRPGIKALLAFNEPYDLVLTERVWALSRRMDVLERFFAELDRRAILFDCATTMWDCVSQRCRHRFYPALHAINKTAAVEKAREPKDARPTFMERVSSLFGSRRAAA